MNNVIIFSPVGQCGKHTVAEEQKMIILMASFGLFLWPHILFSLSLACHTAAAHRLPVCRLSTVPFSLDFFLRDQVFWTI